MSVEAVSWEGALEYCDQNNRNGLLQIMSQDEQKKLETELKNNNVSEPVWVGLRQSRLFGFWIWPNGNAVFPYSNWNGGVEPKHQLSQHCGVVEPLKEYRWRDDNCLTPHRALCQIQCSP